MGLTKCKECGHEISKKADKCPQCGAPQKKKTSFFTWLVLVLIIFGVYVAINTPSNTGSQSVTGKSRVARKPAGAPKFDASHETQGDHVIATPGDILYVQGDVVNMREGPSTATAIIMQLHKGHKLVEIQRRGKWVEVGADRTGGKSGWIHSSLIGKRFVGGSTNAPSDPKFDKFKDAFTELNASVKRKTGITFFTKVENLGDGIVQVTATDTWLSTPQSDRQRNLNTIFQLWDAAEGSGLPIAVYVVDEYGNQRMSMKR